MPALTRKRLSAATEMTYRHPEWMELAAELLFARDRLVDAEGVYSIQMAVAEGLRLAHEMGEQGKNPPMPAGKARAYTPPPIDEEITLIAQELRMLAWSRKSGAEAPEGYTAWNLHRRRQKPAASAPEPAVAPKVIRRQRAAPTPAPIPTLIRRRR